MKIGFASNALQFFLGCFAPLELLKEFLTLFFNNH